ncbi:class II aldolase/adducin family protein [Adhaeretor mobilis]|uniref:L-fuculose phosphate aldolase n=1 Tax=Adhaeretor mobilis TaxID=1930276 RepID=A0A517MYJ4_9BACT|nr:class II aldolase/adducin family protein [Adhaeretor mobilis]QDS99923.1 L-fuculose phosphate aldolase [Adhaeretor mobilis]
METLSRVYQRGMTTASGGNVSILDENGKLWISPARLDKGKLRPQDVVEIGNNGDAGEGQRQPSSELPFHQAIYQVRPDIHCVLHAHPSALVTFSIVEQAPDTRVMRHVYRLCGEVAFTKFRMPGSPELGQEIAQAFAAGANCVVLENHGVVVGGATPEIAYRRFEALERLSRILIRAAAIGKPKALNKQQLHRQGEAIPWERGEQQAKPLLREQELRGELCEFARRGYERNLLVTAADVLSVRIDDAAFLITPAAVDWRDLYADDMTSVRSGIAYGRCEPSDAVTCHRAIYETNPGISAIAHAHPVNVSAFSLGDVPIETDAFPESLLVLRDIQQAPFELPFESPHELAHLVSPKRPIAILANDGALITGKGLLDVFDRLEVLEATAETLIDSRALGPIKTINREAIDFLRNAFPDAYGAN